MIKIVEYGLRNRVDSVLEIFFKTTKNSKKMQAIK